MPIKHEYYVECDRCGEPSGDAGVPIPEPWPSRQDAIDKAVAKDWFYDAARVVLICDVCRTEDGPDDEEDDEEDDEATEPEGGSASWDDMVMAAVRALFPAGTVEAVRESDAFGALASRLQHYCTHSGMSPGDALAEIDADDRAFADRADNPAAFLASRIERP